MAALSTIYYYSTGTVTVDADATTVTGAGTTWTSFVKPGDTLEVAGRQARIREVVSDTSLTLMLPWTGGAQSGASYVIVLDSPARYEGAYVAESAREVIASARVIMAGVNTFAVNSYGTNTPPASPITADTYVVGTSPTGAWAGYAGYLMTWTGTGWEPTAPTQGMQAYALDTGLSYQRGAAAWALSGVDSRQPLDATLTALAGVETAANRVPYFTGVDTVAVTPLTAWARSLLDDADVAAFWTTVGASAPETAAFRRGNALGTVSGAAGVVGGALFEEGSGPNGYYWRIGNGFQVCFQTGLTAVYQAAFVAEATWTFPAPFASPPAVGLVTSNAGGDFVGLARTDLGSVRVTGGTASCGIGFASVTGVSLGATAQVKNLRAMAIGRWR